VSDESAVYNFPEGMRFVVYFLLTKMSLSLALSIYQDIFASIIDEVDRSSRQEKGRLTPDHTFTHVLLLLATLPSAPQFL
jgi:hypothetical protein